MSKLSGYGTPHSLINFYIGNQPSFDGFVAPSTFRGMQAGEIAHIVANTSNHWRKAFNVYAKFMWEFICQAQPALLQACNQAGISTWQEYRDKKLFSDNSYESLLFSPLDRSSTAPSSVSILAGKTYGLTQVSQDLIEVNAQFWIHPYNRIIIAPYPDYRQLTNERITFLCSLVIPLVSGTALIE